MSGHEQALGGFIGLDQRFQVVRLRAAGRRLRRISQRLQHFQPRNARALIGGLRTVRQIAVEVIADRLFGQAQPRRQFGVARQLGLRQRRHQLVHLPRDSARRSGVIDGGRTRGQRQGHREADCR